MKGKRAVFSRKNRFMSVFIDVYAEIVNFLLNKSELHTTRWEERSDLRFGGHNIEFELSAVGVANLCSTS
jgi:hypothetical protein